MNQSIPLVPWNKQQEAGLQTEAFILLLHKLGFHLAADVGKCFPRVPHFWSADHVLTLALKLGDLGDAGRVAGAAVEAAGETAGGRMTAMAERREIWCSPNSPSAMAK